MTGSGSAQVGAFPSKASTRIPRKGVTRGRAVLFDPQLRAAPSLRPTIDSLVANLEALEEALGLRKRRRKEVDAKRFRLAVEALACNLLRLAMIRSDRPLAVPRSSAAMWTKGRYRPPVYGQHFLDVLALMARPESELIVREQTGYRFSKQASQSSTIRPTAGFVQIVPSGLGWDGFERLPEAEVLILRDRKTGARDNAGDLDYGETSKTRKLRRKVEALNRYLQTVPLSIAADGVFLGVGGDDAPIDPTRRAVRRIFNNGRWDHGGRLYGAFWETMRRTDRFRVLRIATSEAPEGECVANIDFGQLFPHLAYVRAQCSPPDADLYDIAGDGSCRAGWKLLVNAMLFAGEQLTHWPDGGSKLFPAGTKLADARAMIRVKHSPIAHLLETGVGHHLMFIESTILMDALEVLRSKDISALPLHDSVLVAASLAKQTKAVLEKIYEVHTGGSARVKIELSA